MSRIQFISLEQWQACYRLPHPPNISAEISAIVGLDSPMTRNYTALVVVTRLHTGDVQLLNHYLWHRQWGKEINFDDIETLLLKLKNQYHSLIVHFDSNQAPELAQRFSTADIPIKEFYQTTANLTKTTSTLFELVTTKRLIPYQALDFEIQIQHTTKVKTVQELQVAKEKIPNYHDLMIALLLAIAEPDNTCPTNPFFVGNNDCLDREWYAQNHCPLGVNTELSEHSVCYYCNSFQKVAGWALETGAPGRSLLKRTYNFSQKHTPLVRDTIHN